MAFTVRSLLSLAQRVVRIVESSSAPAPTRRRRPRDTTQRRVPSPPVAGGRQDLSLAYAPSKDGRPDPGEIVWTWVAYEEDPSQGKDRPVLLIARQGDSLLGLMLTSRDHTNTHERDSRYVDIGTGAWDRQNRPSEVRVDRIITVDPSSVRREGAVLPRDRFEQVVAAVPGALLDRYRR